MHYQKTIFLIDDDSDDQEIFSNAVKRSDESMNCVFANDGILALEKINSEGEFVPDYIFIDLNMPRMNGWEFLEEYAVLEKQQQGKLIVVILTTSENPDEYRRSLNQDIATEFRNKPLTKEMLAELIDKFL